VAAELSATEREDAIPIFARVLPEDLAPQFLSRCGSRWTVARPVHDAHGRRLASICRDDSGSVFLPFDPDEVITSYRTERYVSVASGGRSAGLKRRSMRAYYRLRPALPRGVQIGLRRLFSRLQARVRFPRWPVEAAHHDFYEFMWRVLDGVAVEPLPRVAAWPAGYTWALVLTHDVETGAGFAALDPVLEVERTLGLRSSWNFVPRRYHVDDDRLRDLAEAGFEIGVHGLYHDGRDLESLATLRVRLPAMREAAERWGAIGFRAPATHREWAWMPLLGFDYDTSSPDTDPFEPQAGGCCSWLPFFNEDLVELPLTMPQDHTLFVILGCSDEATWVQKASYLRARGGMALLDTHPDYLLDERVLRAYQRLLERFSADPGVWNALPRDVSAWWRRRAASRIEWIDGSWRVVGPAAEEARVEIGAG
jgi:hypothetical protein